MMRCTDYCVSFAYLQSLTAVVDWMTDIFNEYPMLWSLYGIMLVIPFVLLAACCVSPKVRGGRGKGRESVCVRY